MKKNIAKVFLFFVIFLITNCEGKKPDESINPDDIEKEQRNINTTIKVKQTIMEQAAYYESVNEKKR